MSTEENDQTMEDLKRTTIEMIRWPRGVDEETKRTIMEQKKRKLPAWYVVLGIMEKEKNQMNASLPECIPDDFVEELRGYAEFVWEMRDAFNTFNPKLREEKINLILNTGRLIHKSRLGLRKNLPETTNFATRSLTRLKRNTKILKGDWTGFKLANRLAAEAEFGGYGSHRGVWQAATRYKELWQEAEKV